MLKLLIDKIDYFTSIIQRIRNKFYFHGFTRKNTLDLIWQDFINNPEKFIQEHHAVAIKVDQKTSVYKILVNQHWYVIKRYNTQGLWYRLTHCLSKSRAERSWFFANLLLTNGIQTPSPTLFLEQRYFGLKGASYYVSEYIAATHLHNHAADNLLTEQQAQAIVTMLNTLWENKLYHGDLKATNLLIKENQIYLIDLDAMQLINNPKKMLLAKAQDQTRFLRNWQNSNWLNYFKKNIGNTL